MTTVAIVLIVSVIAFAVLGVPLAWSLGLSSLCAILTTSSLTIGMLAQRMYTGGAVYAFLAIFFFVFAGNIMTYGGLSKRLVRFANGLVGHITGGYLHRVYAGLHFLCRHIRFLYRHHRSHWRHALPGAERVTAIPTTMPLPSPLWAVCWVSLFPPVSPL